MWVWFGLGRAVVSSSRAVAAVSMSMVRLITELRRSCAWQGMHMICIHDTIQSHLFRMECKLYSQADAERHAKWIWIDMKNKHGTKATLKNSTNVVNIWGLGALHNNCIQMKNFKPRCKERTIFLVGGCHQMRLYQIMILFCTITRLRSFMMTKRTMTMLMMLGIAVAGQEI